LKDPAEFTLIGHHVPRIDSLEKSSGRARYTIDIVRPGMLTAVVEHPPQFGARVSRFDAAAARRVAGVRDVVEIPSGVAVVADSFWAATQGRAVLAVDWNFDLAEQRGSAQLVDEFRDLLSRPGAVARDDGDVDAALRDAQTVVEASFEFPYLAHAAMEPLNAVVEIKRDGCEIWTGSQSPTNDQRVAAAILGIDPGAVKINTQFAGGSFGRRSVPDSDYVAEAVAVAKAIGGRAPVKLQWSREDDMRAGRYRPMTLHALRAGLDGHGNVIGWSHRIVGQSFLRGTSMEGMIVDGVDRTIVEGARNLPYTVPNFRCDLHLVDVGVPTLWWRSVGHSHNGYATEAFFDEVAAAAGKDPVALRRQLLRDHPRHRGVLDLAVAKAGPAPTGKGRGRGVAVHAAFRSFVAQVVDVTLGEDGSYSIDAVVCAVDCGIVINPDIVRAQMEGSIGFGLGAVMHEAVVFEAGVVRSTNFDSYRPLRIPEMPPVAVHIVASAEPPTGVGEPGLPPIGPALVNALRAVTGKTVHRLPIGVRVGV
jgi:isoquinoline 1-oxidoreductase beta subunit